eukprot:m.16533 g.16533  ORF g.16533 m.16533 type:complete len:52 (+) comp26991_c0_seq2:505-660(+)
MRTTTSNRRVLFPYHSRPVVKKYSQLNCRQLKKYRLESIWWPLVAAARRLR